MEVLVMQVFVSLLLVAGSLVLLAYSIKQADHEHADRLSLLPLEEDSGTSAAPSVAVAARAPKDHASPATDPQAHR